LRRGDSGGLMERQVAASSGVWVRNRGRPAFNIKPSRSKPDRGIVTVQCETRDQDGDVVQLLRPTLVVMRRS